MPRNRFAFIFALLIAITAGLVGGAIAQVAHPDELERKEKLRGEAKEAIETLESLLSARSERRKQLKELAREIKQVKEPALKKELEEKIKAETEKLAQIEQRATSLTTGVAKDELGADDNKKFDLQSELESLVQPFVKMMKDATENARQIEKLKRTLAAAQKREKLTQRAIERLGLLIEVASEQSQAKSASKNKTKTKKKNPTEQHLSRASQVLAAQPPGG